MQGGSDEYSDDKDVPNSQIRRVAAKQLRGSVLTYLSTIMLL